MLSNKTSGSHTVKSCGASSLISGKAIAGEALPSRGSKSLFDGRSKTVGTPKTKRLTLARTVAIRNLKKYFIFTPKKEEIRNTLQGRMLEARRKAQLALNDMTLRVAAPGGAAY
jgi:hypothetical protein